MIPPHPHLWHLLVWALLDMRFKALCIRAQAYKHVQLTVDLQMSLAGIFAVVAHKRQFRTLDS